MSIHKSSRCSYGGALEGVSWSCLQVCQCVTQLVPGAMDVRLDRAEREVEGRRDLLVGPALHVAQQNTRTILGAEPGDRLFDGLPQLARLQLLQRRLPASLDVEGRRLDLG